MKILVGLSGGVDSAVAAYLLKSQGHEVVGATMSIWDKSSPLKAAHRDACFSPAEQDDIDEAKRICDKLGIAHHVVDCTAAYKKIVLDYFKSEYLSGRTPNPCVWCNGLIKFKALPEAAAAQGVEFDKFATGHYARVEKDETTGRYVLKRAKDPKKDQTYFIYRLRQEQLARVVFPLGDYTKTQIREIAAGIGLTVADKPDSQDFYAGHYSDLLGVTEKTGYFKDVDGNVLGKHKGFWNYTVGQRKGLGVAAKEPLYVLRLDAENNDVILASQKDVLEREVYAKDCNFIAVESITEPVRLTAKVRSTQTPAPATVSPDGENRVKVAFDEWQKPAAAGQSVVFYDGDTVVGGGVLEKTRPAK